MKSVNFKHATSFVAYFFFIYFFSIGFFFKTFEFLERQNILNPEQVRRFAGPALDQNCLQRLSADAMSRQRANGASYDYLYLRYYHFPSFKQYTCTCIIYVYKLDTIEGARVM